MMWLPVSIGGRGERRYHLDIEGKAPVAPLGLQVMLAYMQVCTNLRIFFQILLFCLVTFGHVEYSLKID
jgi:hypothetical protein